MIIWSENRKSTYHCHFGFGSSSVQVISSSLGEWARLTARAGELAKHTESMLCLPDKIHIRRHDRIAELFAAMMDDQESRLPGAKLAFQAHFTLLLRHVSVEAMSELMQQDRPARLNKTHIHVNRALRDLEEHLADPISIHGLAGKLRLNADYLGRVFRHTLGMNIGTYILKRRMARAGDLLLSANMNVKEVAAKVGFRDPLYFSRMFRRQTGLSPTEYILRNTQPSALEGRTQ
ncbi:MAG: helix-turn-helix transcriptional regulator [Planctomycetes bacterium]|nr:helix-turn-helix transcriptional regulator [Planctomycetota bacterium]